MLNASIALFVQAQAPIKVSTIIFDASTHPIVAGGYIEGVSMQLIQKKGLIISKKSNDLFLTDTTNYVSANIATSAFEDYLNLSFDKRTIDCTEINHEEFTCGLTHFIGNTNYYVRAFVTTTDGNTYYGQVENIHTHNYNRYNGRYDFANVFHAFDYTLFDLITDEIINPTTDGYYYSTNENPTTVKFQIGTPYNTCYKFATEWNYKLWYHHNIKHCDASKIVHLPVMSCEEGKVKIKPSPNDDDKDITIYYSINENGTRPEKFTHIYTEPLHVPIGSTVFCYAISDNGYMSFTNQYTVLEQNATNRYDINHDGVVDIFDINILLNVLLGYTQGYSTTDADINNDGTVDIFDINETINVMLGYETAPEPISPKTYTVNGVSFTMVAVEGGTFTMGATSEQGSDAVSQESPVHQVTLSSYSIGQTEVTQELWQAVMGSNPSYFTGDLQRPVEQVNWNDCQTFISKLNQMTGLNFRLPTEAEWEYAARGGNRSQGYKYAGSSTVDDVAWYDGNSGSTTHPVATKAPNELGLYDMCGNVFEWCQDWYGSYGSDGQTNPIGPASGSTRVVRGGCWYFNDRWCRVSSRSESTPPYTKNRNGMRLAL